MRTLSDVIGIIIICILLGLIIAIAVVFVDRAHAEEREVSDVAKAILHLKPDMDMLLVDTLASLYEAEFEDEGEDPIFAVALSYKESSLNPRAYNESSGCKGLFQIHPVHRDKCTYDIEKNVAAGAEIWSRYLERKDGDRLAALKRYGHKESTAKATIKLYEELVEVVE